MHDFKYKNNQLYCENVPVARIAGRIGTPVYIYSKKTLLDHFNKLDTAFAGIPHLICFSIKSNANINIIRALAKAGSGVDIVSGGELYRALSAGVSPKKIVYAGVGKTDLEIETALRKKILLFTIESESELANINKIAKSLNTIAPALLRINPGVDPHTHKHVATGKKETKFGLDIDTSRRIYLQYKKYPNIRFLGVHIHIGSQITQPLPYVQALRKILPLIKEIKTAVKTIKYLDIGGGLGIIYHKEQPATAEKFANAVLPLLREAGLTVILEPGRFIPGNAGILAAKVLYTKKTPVKNFVILDAAMNDLVRPSLYGAYHSIVPVAEKKSGLIKADIVGPICESGDFFALDRKIERPKEGDYLAIMGAGAYCFSMSSNYNSRPRAAEVLVDGNKYTVIRKRETYEDLIRNER